jgi:hypothetical protein
VYIANINRAPLDPATEMEAAHRRSIPSGASAVEEVADACVFVCAGEAGFPTGANTSIDGAYSRV